MKKYCPNCNEEYGDNCEFMFCSKCGSALQTEVTEDGSKKKKRRGVIKRIILAGLLLIVVVGTAIGISIYLSPEGKIDRYLKKGDWGAAQEVYVEAVQGDEAAEEKLKKSLAEIIEEVKKNYINQSIEYDTAMSMLDGVNRIIKNVSGYTDVKEYISTLMKSRKSYASAEKLFSSKDYVEAIGYYKQVWSEDVNYADAQNKIKTAKAEYKSIVLQKAEEFSANGKYDDAIKALQEAQMLLTDDGELVALVTQYRKEEIINNFLSFEQKGDFAGGIAYGKANASIIGETDELRGKLGDYERKYREEIISQVKIVYEAQGYTAAVAIINEGLTVLPEDNELLAKQKECADLYRAEILKQSQVKFNEQGYEAATEVLNRGLSVLIGDAEIIAEQKKYADLYRADILNQAQVLFNESGYEAAIEAVNKALKVLTNDEELLAARKVYESYAPVLLFKQVILTGDDDWVEKLGSGTDNVGTKYQNAYRLYVGWDEDVTYILNGQFTRLEGKLALSSADKNNKDEVVLEFYGDGKLLGCSPRFKSGVKPQSFSIDVTGITDLRIVCLYGSYGCVELYTEGLYLYK